MRAAIVVLKLETVPVNDSLNGTMSNPSIPLTSTLTLELPLKINPVYIIRLTTRLKRKHSNVDSSWLSSYKY